MNRADRMLEVLLDGRPHTRRDLFDRCGFFLTNNAAAELRAQGHDVRQSRACVNGDIVYSYQLFPGSLPKPSLSAADLPPGDDSSSGSHDHTDGGREGSESEQAELFTYPRTPAWG